MAVSPHRHLVLIAPVLLLVAVGAGIFGVIYSRQQSTTPAAPAVPTVDTRLILRPQHVPVSGTLTDGSRLTGSIYPGIPYQNNTLQLTMRHQGQAVPAQGQMAVSVTMLGMRMLPVKGTLYPVGAHFSGELRIPMFGSYLGQVALTTPTGPLTGTIALEVPLPRL